MNAWPCAHLSISARCGPCASFWVESQLLRSSQFANAREMLLGDAGNQRALYLLSLLYRYDDDYETDLNRPSLRARGSTAGDRTSRSRRLTLRPITRHWTERR